MIVLLFTTDDLNRPYLLYKHVSFKNFGKNSNKKWIIVFNNVYLIPRN